MRFTEVFLKTADAVARTDRFVSSCGGTRSGKTISILQYLFLLISQDSTPTINSIVSETMPHLKRGAIRDMQTCIDLYDESNWNKGESIYRFPNGSILEFFSADQIGKVHGPKRDRLFLNECQNIDYEIARQLFVRTTGLIFLDYNPTCHFWVNDKIENRDTCVSIHSTYLDNKDYATGESMLSREQIIEIESNKSDANWWNVYGLGKEGTLEGLIYNYEQVEELPNADGLIETYGMDFGFTNDPTALIHCIIDNRKKGIYLDEICYGRGMLNSDIIKVLREQGISRTTPIYADCAEPKTIAEIHSAGYNCKPCYKAGKKAEQIQAIKGYTLYITKRSINLLKEVRGYTWDKDKDGEFLNEPIAVLDHGMDAFRYGVFLHITNNNKGKYNIR